MSRIRVYVSPDHNPNIGWGSTVGFVECIEGPAIQRTMIGAAGAWLNERNHPAVIIVFIHHDDAFVEFDDPELAMLFKLTWL